MTGRILTFLSHALCFALVASLYEDQVGKFDWRQQYIGKVTDIFWDQSYTAGKRVLAASELNAVASIHTINGTLAWRKLLEDNDRGTVDATIHEGSAFITVNGGGRFVRSWNPGTGTVYWESNVSSKVGKSASVLIYDKELVVALTAGGVFGLDLNKGKQKWKVPLPQSDAVFTDLVLQGINIYIVGRLSHDHVMVVAIDIDGNTKSQRSIPAAWLSDTTSCTVIGGKFYVCCNQGNLHLLDLIDGQVFTATELKGLGLKQTGDAKLETLAKTKGDNDVALLRLAKDHIVILRASKTGFQVVKDLPKVSAAQIGQYDEKDLVLTLQRSGDELLFKCYDILSGGEIAEMAQKITYLKNHGFPIKMEVLLFKRRDGRIGHRTVVVSEDYSLQLIQQKYSKVMWRREESLAYVLGVEMIDLPVSENQAKFEDEFGSHKDDVGTMFLKRFSTQVSQLKTFVEQQIQKLQGHKHHHHDSEVMAEVEEDDEELMRDEFNLKKMIVVVTASGKIFGLRSNNGHIEWEYFLPDLSPFNSYGKQKLLLFVQRTTAHFPNPPQCAVVGKHKVSGNGYIFAFNPITGEPVQNGVQMKNKILQATLLGEMDDHFLRGVMVLDENHKVHLFPDSCKSTAGQMSQSLFMFTANQDTGLINGFRVASAKQELIAEPIWNVNLQKKQQTITNIVGKRLLEHVHSQGRVLGDRSVLYKYLNPNLVVIVTEGELQDITLQQKGPSNFVNIYLLDSVTGHLVFHGSHKRARGPVHVIHSENWVVYNYYSQKSRRNEMAVLELFEGKSQNNATAFSSFSAPRQPLVLRQSYIMPLPISTMTTTVTEKGITSKHIIFAITYGGLLSLPKALLDPRRPLIPNQETMEEGTIPYIPELPVNAEAIINYYQSVYNVRGIHTSPAGLESTSLVLTYGVDLYCTQVTPSKMFDVLKEDFDYVFISAVVIGMFLVTFITQKLAARKALSRAWK